MRRSQSQNLCDGNFGRLIPDPAPNQCFRYINCILSTPQFHECNEGEIFVDNQCSRGDRETCEVDSLETICRGVFFGARPLPNDETGRMFVGCVNGIGTIHSCLENELFDIERNQCVAQGPAEHPCTRNPGQTIVNPTDCSRFIVCAIFIPIHYSCPSRMIYSVEQNRCLVGSTDFCMVTAVENVCHGNFFGALPHPESDRFFIGCSRGVQTVFTCDEPRRFESTLGECI